ncbi:MAG: hypothetical protein HONBIEJF_00942 [Fimbriimonadaceae bacterium]|nr:hypothetical protein [Fimbriimonadaceae bacterium]
MRTAIAVLVLAAALASEAATITSLNKSSLPRSGRLAILGSGFGAFNGTSRVTIGGEEAWITTWTSTRIVAFVRESTRVGIGDVTVHTNGESSNSMPVTIRNRARSLGRLAWRFEADDLYIMTRPAVAPDGTVYAKGINGHTYALGADGGLKWVFNDGQTAPGDMSLMQDGTIVIGGANAVIAIWPNGTLRWSRYGLGTEFSCGPTVGPDGRVYGVANPWYGGIGAFVLDQNGNLDSVASLRTNVNGVSYPTRIEFDADHWYFCLPPPNVGGGYGELHAMDYSGSIDWIRTGQGQSLALVNGNIYVQRANEGNNYGAYDANGNVKWEHPFNTLGVPQFFPNKGLDGSVYQVYGGTGLARFAPDGTIAYKRTYPGFSMQYPTVTPNNQEVIVNGTTNLPDPRQIVSYRQDGTVRWRMYLPFEGGVAIAPMSVMTFSPDARVVYQGMTWNNYATDTHTYLYAVRTGSFIEKP